MSKLFADLYTKTINIEGEKLTIQKLSLKDQMDAGKLLETDMMQGSLAMIKASLKKWVDEDGKSVSITEENITRLRADIVLKLSEEITKYNNLEKDKEKN